MRVEINSGEYNVIAAGHVLLFSETDLLTIKVFEKDIIDIKIGLQFVDGSTEGRHIETDVRDDMLVLVCHNFVGAGTGLRHPVKVAEVDGKAVYISFWTYLEGSQQPQVRSVKYTLFW